MSYFVTAIGTDSGKTVISAALSLALEADYWKPIQAGMPTDSNTIKKLTNGKVHIHPERYVLNTPASPHYAAGVDNININLADFELPQTRNKVIVEGAGGCLVPINNEDFVIDLASNLNLPVILISNNYLGSINHTLLSLAFLKYQKIDLKGIIFNGTPNKATEDIVLKHAQAPCIHKVKPLKYVNKDSIIELSNGLKESLYELD